MNSEELIIIKEAHCGDVRFQLVRVKATPKHKLRILCRDSVVWESKPFLVKNEVSLTERKFNRILALIERVGVPVMAYIDDIKKALIEVLDAIPSRVVVPSVEELNLKFKKVRIENINAGLLYQPIEVEAQIIGASEYLSIPVTLKLICKRHGERRRVYLDFTNPQRLELMLFNQKLLIREIELKANIKLGGEHHKFVVDKSTDSAIDLKILKLRELPEEHEKFSESQQFKTIDCYLIGRDMPKSKKVRVKGYVVNRPLGNVNRLVIVAFNIEPLNEVVENFRVTEDLLNELRDLLPPHSLPVREQYEKLKDLADTAINPRIVGRRFEKLCSLLTLLSPFKVMLESTRLTYYGMLRIIHYGDTKTAKTETNASIFYDLGLGDYATCETGTRTGILYTIDTEMRTIIWGVLPLCDMEVAIIDGFDRFPRNEMGELREALEHHIVRVRRFVSGDAYVRTRIIDIANPKRHLKLYAFNVQAVKEIPPLTTEPDYTRFDLYVPWAKEDVDIEDIVKSSRPRDIELENRVRKLVLAAWNTIAIIPKDIEPELNKLVIDFVKRAKGIDIPVVHDGWKKVICKIAGSFACLLQKFKLEANELRAIVDGEVVEFVRLFLEEYFDRLEIEQYASQMKKELSDEECKKILKELGKVERKILKELYKRERATREELAQVLNMSTSNLTKTYLPRLRKHMLILSISGKGITLTDTGRQLAVKLLGEEG